MTKRRIPLVIIMLALLVLVSQAVVSVGRSAQFKSSITTEERLLAHGVDLEAVPAFGSAPRVTASQARDIAVSVTRIATGPEETHHVLARPTAGAALRSSWLVLFAGGEHGGSLGPLKARTRESSPRIIRAC